MDVVFIVIALAALVQNAQGLNCSVCEDNGFDGESNRPPNCFTTPSAFSDTCSSASAVYCRTKFTLQDGMVTNVDRRCISPSSDEDETSTSMPTADKCITILSNLDPVDTTNCFYHCDVDNCNIDTTTTLKTCASDCSWKSRKGACNYITGTCVCNTGYTGPDCSSAIAPTYRSCVQCNSETDSGCATSTKGTTCPGTQQYCSSAKTITFDLTTSPQPIRTIITRGCTSDLVAVNECKFSNIYNDDGLTSSNYSEYTCYSTCDTDNCNTNTPDGTIDDSEEKTIHCHQCSSSFGDCNSGRTLCPSSATHCKATVVYLISPKTDLSYEAPPEYQIQSVVRECASAPVTRECKESNVIDSLSLKKITCQETCQTDGCNIGWPARPTCLQCSTIELDLTDGYDVCLENPGRASSCPNPHDKYCYTSDIAPRDGNQGYPRRIERGCSYYNRGNGCSTQTIRGVSFDQCNYTCTSDECNVGNTGSSPIPSPAATLTFTLSGLMFQFRL